MDQNKKQGLNTTQIILIVGFLLLLIAVGAATFFIIKSQKQNSGTVPQPPVTGGNLVVDESNLEDIEKILTDSVADGMFEINMNAIWNFPDGKSASTDAYVANSHANHYSFTFEILLDGTEVIYSSSLVPVGSRIKEIALDKELEAGTYDAVCMYHLWTEDGVEDSSCGVNITINVSE